MPLQRELKRVWLMRSLRPSRTEAVICELTRTVLGAVAGGGREDSAERDAIHRILLGLVGATTGRRHFPRFRISCRAEHRLQNVPFSFLRWLGFWREAIRIQLQTALIPNSTAVRRIGWYHAIKRDEHVRGRRCVVTSNDEYSASRSGTAGSRRQGCLELFSGI